MSRCVLVCRPGHPKANHNDMVDVRDLGDWDSMERAIDAPIMSGRFYENQKTVEGHDIGSRQKHRTYMKDRGLTTTDDFDRPGGYWDRAEKERQLMRQGIFPDRKERREEVARINYEVEKKHARRR